MGNLCHSAPPSRHTFPQGFERRRRTETIILGDGDDRSSGPTPLALSSELPQSVARFHGEGWRSRRRERSRDPRVDGCNLGVWTPQVTIRLVEFQGGGLPSAYETDGSVGPAVAPSLPLSPSLSPVSLPFPSWAFSAKDICHDSRWLQLRSSLARAQVFRVASNALVSAYWEGLKEEGVLGNLHVGDMEQ